MLREGKLVSVSAEGEQLVVPKHLRSKVLHLAHSIPWPGHLGQQKTLGRISNRFYWSGLYQEVIAFCHNMTLYILNRHFMTLFFMYCSYGTH